MELSYFALIGAPNCGKTVLFNGLTGAHAKVANYPGVTVDKREGAFLDDEAVRIVDLPGTYSLRTTSPDEAVAKDVAVGKLGIPPDAIIAVADATNLRMTLRMILELKTLKLPMVVSLNMSDVAQRRGLNIDAAKLSELLGVPVLETVAVSASGVQAVREAVAQLPRKRSFPANPASAERTLDELDSDALYHEVESILAQVVRTEMTLPAWHKKLDEIVLHPVWGVVLLMVILFMVFQAVYTWAAPIMEAIEGGFGWLGEWVAANMQPGILNDLIVNGVIAGTGSVLVFLPQITILFAFILLLEDSGYLPRAAFLLDNVMAKSGLSGRSFIPLLSSFACAVPAVMSARTIHDPRERLVTIAVAPLLTCSARLPVYALIIAAVIPNQTVFGIFNLQGLTLFVLYIAGILSAALAAYLMKRLARIKGNVQQFPLLMELPTFRTPNFKHILTSLWDRVKAFLKRRGYDYFRADRDSVGLGELACAARRRNRRGNRLQPGRYDRPRHPAAVRTAGLHLGNVHRHDSGHRRTRSGRRRAGHGVCRGRVVRRRSAERADSHCPQQLGPAYRLRLPGLVCLCSHVRRHFGRD